MQRLLRPLLTSLALLAGPVMADPYQVEVLLFRQSAEQLPAHTVPEDWNQQSTPVTREFERTPLLETEATRLQEAGGYQILSRKAWLQDLGEQAQTISYSDGELRDGHGLVDVLVSLSQERDQRVTLDFTAWVNRFDADGFLTGSEQISQQRRLMPGQLIYIDHPSLGALLRLRPQ